MLATSRGRSDLLTGLLAARASVHLADLEPLLLHLVVERFAFLRDGVIRSSWN